MLKRQLPRLHRLVPPTHRRHVRDWDRGTSSCRTIGTYGKLIRSWRPTGRGRSSTQRVSERCLRPHPPFRRSTGLRPPRAECLTCRFVVRSTGPRFSLPSYIWLTTRHPGRPAYLDPDAGVPPSRALPDSRRRHAPGRTVRKDFPVPVRALSAIFRGKFMAKAKRMLPDQA